MLQQKRLCPNGLVGEQIVLSLKLSDYLWGKSAKLSEEKIEEIEEIMTEALNIIEGIIK